MYPSYRKLGSTGFDVSVLGFGTWQIGGGRWATSGEEEALRTLRTARDAGVNIFDAAVVYGQYADARGYCQSRSQELLGKAFGPMADDIFICTKVGQYDELSHRGNFGAERLVEQVRQSLRRLRTDVLDICLVHAPSLSEVRRGLAIEVLRTLQAIGWIRAVGYSFENEPCHVMNALDQPIDVIMLQYNILDSQCGEAIDRAQERGIGVLVGGPYKRGYLTGRYRSLEDLPMEDDYWSWNVRRNPRKVAATLQQVATMAKDVPAAADLRARALQFVVSKSGVSSAIVGHRSAAELVENLEHIEYLGSS
ncbi:aldo/keto reductase [Micromonospora saelicesensis]|uniref:Predicted oxidoreductase n=1 Tax=Micromonospora saelicesensis TaxID=285676 RepID=A0A1C4Z7Y0_9ACTN|nr:aldo/keto reductase [Micromonospora saelicesensis]SCF29036.1 Predicted oxidoreductase [Micromonospora saelicesensis]